MPLNEDILCTIIQLAPHAQLLELCYLSSAVHASVVCVIYHSVELRSYNEVAQFLRAIKVISPRSQRLTNAVRHFVECVDTKSLPSDRTALLHGAIAVILDRLTSVLGVKLAIVDSQQQHQSRTSNGMRSVYAALSLCTRLRHLSLRGVTVTGLQQLATDLIAVRRLESLDLTFAEHISVAQSIILVGRLCASVRALTLPEEFLQSLLGFCQVIAASDQAKYSFSSVRYLCCLDRRSREVLPRHIAEASRTLSRCAQGLSTNCSQRTSRT